MTLAKINETVVNYAKRHDVEIRAQQSNHEGEIVSKIGSMKDKCSGLLINPAAYTHTSIAIRDAITATSIPTVEVHLSNIYAREEFRQNSLISAIAVGHAPGLSAR